MAPVTRTRSKHLDKGTNEQDSQVASAVRGNDKKKNERQSDDPSPSATDKSLAVRTREELVSVADVAPDPQSASKQLEEEASQQLRGKEERKSRHVVFDDDNDIDTYVAAAAETARDTKQPSAAVAGTHEDGDSDDGPEAVSTKIAAKETLEAVKALADATEKQATLLKRKRQERDSLFKQQAQKRKRISEQDVDEGEAAPALTTAAGRRRVENPKLPSMLPAEFLTDSSSEGDEETALSRVVKRPRKINFEDTLRSLDKTDRAPRDQVVGATVYRVVADQGNKNLAPRMHKGTRNVKEGLLQRKRAAVAPNKKGGFFVRE